MTTGLLLIHAFPVDARMWGELSSGPNVIAPHLPGFGRTEAVPGGVMTMPVAAGLCLDALDAAGLDRAVVVGLSLGGYVAFELWREAPSRVAGLVLANTRAGADTPEAADGRRGLAERLRSEGNVLVDAPPPLLGERAPEVLWSRVRGWIADQPPEAIAAAALGMAARPDSTGDLAGISVPTIVITSDLDTLIPADVTAPMADQIPGARLETIDGVGHLSNVEAPERFSELVLGHARACGAEV